MQVLFDLPYLEHLDQFAWMGIALSPLQTVPLVRT